MEVQALNLCLILCLFLSPLLYALLDLLRYGTIGIQGNDNIRVSPSTTSKAISKAWPAADANILQAVNAQSQNQDGGTHPNCELTLNAIQPNFPSNITDIDKNIIRVAPPFISSTSNAESARLLPVKLGNTKQVRLKKLKSQPHPAKRTEPGNKKNQKKRDVEGSIEGHRALEPFKEIKEQSSPGSQMYISEGDCFEIQLSGVRPPGRRGTYAQNFEATRPGILHPNIYPHPSCHLSVDRPKSSALSHGINQAMKRSFDIILSLIIILFVLSWMIPLLALLIKTNSKGPVFFVQLRTGKNGTPFKCYKFRSMYVNEQADTLPAQPNDSRFTAIGRILRRTSIDELPQFFNVLINDMSVIGPRPHMLKQTAKYRSLVSDFMLRQIVKPGITGWAQVNGCRGETKKLEQMARRIQHDIFYLENWTFLLDIRITLKTIRILLKKEKNVF
jgi:putative colanic acid biosynthesis UDP-glucose lipid carrier transferase